MSWRTLGTLAALALGAPLAAQPSRSASPPSSSSAALPAGFVPIEQVTPLRGALAVPVSLQAERRPLATVLEEIARQARLSYAADPQLPGLGGPVTLRVQQLPARDALVRALTGTPLRAIAGPAGQVVVMRRDRLPADSATLRESRRLRLSGYLRSAASNEVIRRAMILVDGDAIRRESNEEGFYVLLLDAGTHRLQFRAIGFAPLDTTLTLTESTTRDIVLRPRDVVLAAVRVQGTTTERGDLDPKLPDMSVARLDLKTVRQLPPLLGEVDPIRTLTLLPGVTTANDASTAFSVRGGSVDQNLILLDESTIYNPSHVLGFLSTFNADAVDDVVLYKGAIPARYGGRLSSVVDVRQREGNARTRRGSASIGLLASRGLLEGPLPVGRGSYMLAARRSYADAFLGLSSDTTLRNQVAYFYDVNAKMNVRLGQTGSLMLSGYLGRDAFGQPSANFGVGWGNRSATLRWNQGIGRLFSKVTASTSDYDYRLDFRFEPTDSARWTARILGNSLKVDETFRLTERQTLEFGGEIIDHEFRPGRLAPRGDSTVLRSRTVETRLGISTAAYLGHEIEVTPRVAVRYGLRYGAFRRHGPATRYRYANDAPVIYNAALGRYEPGRVIDSTRVSGSTTLAHYDGLEPRASLRVSTSENSSIKASYARTQQFLQLVSNTNSPTPLDVWEPVGEWIRPQRADQVALGWSARRGDIEYTVETYYKRARNVVDYIDGADVVLNSRLETLLVQGEGRAYGLELYARRTAGKLTGWASYTLARAEQRFPVPARAGATRGGGVNNGNWYRSPFDKTHNLSLVGVYQRSPRWSFGSTFLLASGLPTTLPQSRYMVDGFLIADYGPRNSARLPLYHRLDLSATRTIGRGELQLGVLNAYNRFNAQSLRVRQQTANPLVAEAVQTSIFGLVPSVNYVFRF